VQAASSTTIPHALLGAQAHAIAKTPPCQFFSFRSYRAAAGGPADTAQDLAGLPQPAIGSW